MSSYLINSQPIIHEVSDFLSQDEVAAVLRSSNSIIAKQSLVSNGTTMDYDPLYRRSKFKDLNRLCEFSHAKIIKNATILTGSNSSEILNCQIITYNPGDFFKKHRDKPVNEHISDHRIANRVLSFVILLEKPIEGGNLIIYEQVKDFPLLVPYKFNAEIGDIIFFSSYLVHEVQKITRGIRKTLVGWIGNSY